MVDSQSMGMNPGGFSLAGAVDLEGVKRKAEALAKREAAEKSGKPQSKMPSAGGYVIDVNEQTFQAMVQTSVSFPIILLVWQKSDETSYDLAQKLADSITALDGRMQLARIDADESPSIAQALRAQQLPAVYGLVGGRPMPICQGLPSADELQQICNDILPQLVKVAEKSGVAGMVPYVDSGDSAGDSKDTPVVGVGDDSAVAGDSSDVPPEHKIAHEAAMNGDYALAASEYEKVLQANPNDSLASRERAKALLLGRNANTNVDAVRKAAGDNPGDASAQLAVADVDMIDGHIEDAFSRLLDFLAGHRDSADVIKERMLEYFAMLPAGDERLNRARRRLAVLLY
ncbi:tetratricopeptide repeat protein [Gardnerella vaginalis]|uniref:co-chaperone YbbN n=1 Tax=Gardnerella vaginalis TaxID=2702 RepID=UPI00200D0EE0|nr:tetratricopeptide repeat protein [Gardnerella vaginalis]UQA78377.1 tetratricopeptide repeat protein [Gardnerella vaginalis]UQA81852.1 tetratricopeptide repeat protein [Gardnerella vaginalis]UQA84413.1 tetratricopeptide repeat protein [Gardnerella vaginalis]